MLRVVITTVESLKQAEELSDKILKRKLASCVSIFPITSKYWWKGEIERAEEILLLIKTHQELVQELLNFLKVEHPYEVPEILVIPVEIANEDYLRWVEDVTVREAASPDR
jgi:periplasmic divalent cation tolerance protein